MHDSDLLSSPAMPDKFRASDITPVEFTVIKSRTMTLTRSLQCRAFSRAVIDQKTLSPLFPVRGWGGGRRQWLQITGALHAFRFMA